MTTFADLASEAYDWFERKTRDNGDVFYSLKDGRPDWVHDLVMDAHGDFMPDDWRYDAIHSILGQIHDYSLNDENDASESQTEICDGLVDTYNSARSDWLGSHLHRGGYVDDAVENFGHSDQGVYGDIGLGQFQELEEIYAYVVGSLQVELDERETADDDESDED